MTRITGGGEVGGAGYTPSPDDNKPSDQVRDLSSRAKSAGGDLERQNEIYGALTTDQAAQSMARRHTFTPNGQNQAPIGYSRLSGG